MGSGLPFEQDPVDGEQRVGMNAETVSGRHHGDRYFLVAAIGTDPPGGLRSGLHQRADLTVGPVLGKMFQCPGEAEEKQEQGAFDIGPDRCRSDRNREHQKVDVQPAAPEVGRSVDCGVPASRDHAGSEKCHREPGRGRRGGPQKQGSSEKSPAQTSLECESLPFRAVFLLFVVLRLLLPGSPLEVAPGPEAGSGGAGWLFQQDLVAEPLFKDAGCAAVTARSWQALVDPAQGLPQLFLQRDFVHWTEGGQRNRPFPVVHQQGLHRGFVAQECREGRSPRCCRWQGRGLVVR